MKSEAKRNNLLGTRNGAGNSAQIIVRHPGKLFQQTMTSPGAGVSKWFDSKNKRTLYLELCPSSKLHFIAFTQGSKNCHRAVTDVNAISCKSKRGMTLDLFSEKNINVINAPTSK